MRYPFGHGLSYARFAYSGLSVQRAGEQLVVRCRIENVGSMTAAETVQLYLAPPRKVAFAPPQILTGFARRTLAPGGGGNYLHSCAAGCFLLQSRREVLEGGGRRL